jgi:hypothetical protein
VDAFLRKCRGVLGTAATWAAVWAAIFAAVALIIGVIDPDSIDAGEGPLSVAGVGAVFGFVSGAGFGALLALAEGRKAIRELAPGRAALWGALGTAVYPLLTPVGNEALLIVCPIGAALAAASVAVAKRAELGAGAERPELPR